MGRKLFIHIGPPKTGTSSLQWFLRAQRDRLLEEGIFYPEDDAHNWQSQRRLGFALRRKADPKNGDIPDLKVTLDDLHHQIENTDAHTIVLSSEEFFAMRPEAVHRLLDAFASFDIQIVFYPRRQDDAYISSFTQRVKVARRQFTEPIHSFLDEPHRMSRGLDFYRRGRVWAKNLGKDRIAARLFDGMEDIRSDFMAMLGNGALIQLAQDTAPEKSNKSPTLEAIEHIRVYKSLVKDPSLYGPASKALIEHFSSGQRPGNFLATDDRRRILEFFRLSNESFFEEFLGMENRFDPDLLLGNANEERATIDTSNTVELVNNLIAERRRQKQIARAHAKPRKRILSALPGRMKRW
ncbi:hypothetical protein [Parvibaculum sp.]|uniref:hypothetical protein n=1 Tax=Parvibaculum sp. TaxID=2024848 RepID=UPI003BAC1FC5